MGNSYKKDKNLRIHIETEKGFYNSGSTIEGVVFVEALQNFTFDALYIRVEGDEWCQWFEGSSKNRRKYTGNQNFYTVQHVLQRYPSKHLEKGYYAYPFAFQLSQNIPGSYTPKNYDAKIEYKMVAYFVDFSNKKNSTQLEYMPLIIRQPFRQQVLPYQGTVERAPKTCFCFNQGAILINAWFERNVAYSGENIKIEITADNKHGKKDLNKFVAELVQYTFVSANNGVFRSYSKVISRENIIQHVRKNEKRSFQHVMKIPDITHQTAISTLVANYYRIEVSTKAGLVTSQDPCIYAPIYILKKDLIEGKKKTKLPKAFDTNIAHYKTSKPQFFAAPEYWFKKNKNLAVMNFKLQEQFGIATHENS